MLVHKWLVNDYLTSTLISSPSKADIGVSQLIGVLSLSESNTYFNV